MSSVNILELFKTPYLNACVVIEFGHYEISRFFAQNIFIYASTNSSPPYIRENK